MDMDGSMQLLHAFTPAWLHFHKHLPRLRLQPQKYLPKHGCSLLRHLFQHGCSLHNLTSMAAATTNVFPSITALPQAYPSMAAAPKEWLQTDEQSKNSAIITILYSMVSSSLHNSPKSF